VNVTRGTWKASLAIALTCLLVRAVLVVATRAYERVNHVEFDKIAIAVASGEGFSNAFGRKDEPNTGPTAHYPPVYPYVLSWVYRIGGVGVGGEIGKYVFNVLFVCLVYGALPLVARNLGMPGRAGLYAGLFGAAVPVYLLTELRGGEVALVGLLLVIATLSFRATMLRPSFGWREAAGHGLLWGVMLSTSPSPAPVLALWIGLLFLEHRPPLGTAARFSAVLVATLLALQLPWVVRNYLVLGSPVWARSNLGLELQVSNNDLATPTASGNQLSLEFDRYHPNRSLEERLRYRELGEVAYQRQKMQEAIGWIADHPTRFARLTAARIWYFWTAAAWRPAQVPVLYGVSGLAAFGLWRLLRTQRSAGMQLAALWLGFSLVYCFVQFENRYRYPIFWSLLLMAGFGLTQMSWFRRAERRVIEGLHGDRKASATESVAPVAV
jgi:hypothetical protein